MYVLYFPAASPIYLKLTSVATNYSDLSEAAFTCTGNIGRPLGTLRLLRSTKTSNFSDSNHFFAEQIVSGSELEGLLTSADRLANGTYYLSYVFYKNMTRLENGIDFMCEIVHEIPTVSLTASNKLTVYVNCKYKDAEQICPYLVNFSCYSLSVV